MTTITVVACGSFPGPATAIGTATGDGEEAWATASTARLHYEATGEVLAGLPGFTPAETAKAAA